MSITATEARARAERRFTKLVEHDRRTEEVQKAEEARRRATETQIERLRALRLAKEAAAVTPEQQAADREAEKQRADLLSIGQPAMPPKPRRARKTMQPRTVSSGN